MEAELIQIEEDILSFTSSFPQGYISMEQTEFIMDMERKKKKILVEKELSIKLKSRATWLLHGDGNTKFFHNLFKNRTIVNTIR